MSKFTDKEDSKSAVMDAPATPEAKALEAKTIELVSSREYIAQAGGLTGVCEWLNATVKDKHPDYYMAWPSHEDARRPYLGWTPLSIDYKKGDVFPAVSFDSAEKTRGAVLCWQPMALHRLNVEKDEKKRRMMNSFVNKESSKTQAEAFNQINPAPDGIQAAPLGFEDN